MLTSASRRWSLTVISGFMAACLLAFGSLATPRIASAASGDFEFNQIQEKARSGDDLSLSELKVLADPYRSPSYANLSVAEKELLVKHNNNPTFHVTVSLNPDTGLVESVEATPLVESRNAKLNNPCKRGDTCLYSGRVPYADWGISRVGTTRGYWEYRVGVYTGNHWVSDICWETRCFTGALAPDVNFHWDGKLVTMDSIRLFS